MTGENGISAVATSPLGAYGLNMSGAYSSYPSMTDMYGMGAYGMNPYGMNPMTMSGYGSVFGNGMGMMGMYSPEYMTQWANAQNTMEVNQLLHAQDINRLMLDGRVNASAHANTMFVNEVLQDASIKNLMSGLIDSIDNKDLVNFCKYFDNLKKQVIKSHGESIKANYPNENINLAATEIIESLYTTVAGARPGKENANLRQDLQSIGETAIVNGFKCGERPGHSDMDLKTAMNHCFGTEITEREHDKVARQIGSIGGHTWHGMKTAVETAAIGTGLSVLGSGAAKFITYLVPAAVEKTVEENGKKVTKKALGSLSTRWSKNKVFLKLMGKGAKLSIGIGAAIGLVEAFRPGTITNLLGITQKQQATT